MAETKAQSSPTPENPRKAIREARLNRLRVVDGPKTTITVYPGNEDMRRALRHANGTRFRDALDQPVEWPNDSFTARRIADGSILTDGPATTAGDEPAAPDESLNPREHAHARKRKHSGPRSEHPKPERPRAEQPKPQPKPVTAAAPEPPTA